MFNRLLVAFALVAVLVGCSGILSTHSDVINQDQQQAATSSPASTPIVRVELNDTTKKQPELPRWEGAAQHLWDWIISWQFLTLVIVGLLLLRPRPVDDLLSTFQSMEVFGAKFQLNQLGGADTEERVKKLRRRVGIQFDRWTKRNNLQTIFDRAIDDVLTQLPDLRKTNPRSTLYVADLLSDETLYQVLDYHPGTGGLKGRVFSSRYGIIGRAWRLEQSQYDPEVPGTVDELIRVWGMTQSEARMTPGRGKHCFAAIVLYDRKERPVGLIYIDSCVPAGFGESCNSDEWKRFETSVVQSCKTSGLVGALEALDIELIRKSAQINFYSR